MSHRRRRSVCCRPVALELESRVLLAGAPLFIDFGQSGSATTYSTMSNAYVAGTSITTPAHQNGGVANTYNVYNNVSTSNPSSLVWADGTTATGVSLNWGRAATSGGTVDFTNSTGLSTPTVTGANTINKEMDNSLYNDVIYATAQEEGVQITGLSPGSYYVYFTNNRVYSTEAPKFFADQVGTNLTQFDSTLAQIGGDFRLDGVFNAPGDYIVAKVTLVAGDKLTLISHSYGGTFDASGVYTPPNNQFNMLEIVPVSAGTDATPISSMQSGAYRWAGSQGPTNLNAVGQWISKSNLWGEDFLAYDSWNSLTDQNSINWLTTPWASWVAAQAGRRLVLGVGMIPSTGGATLATGATGLYTSKFETLAHNLINDGLGNSIIRLGWEFNGSWYPWAANGHQADFISYWQQIVTAMRNVSVTGKINNLQFVWNPASGYQQFPSTQAYPGDAYVDYIGEDVYDESYLANTYPFPVGDSASDIQARREVAIANKFTENYGVNALATFAASHGKPFAIPEWGVANRADGHGGLDDPLFIQTMHSFISNPGNNVAFNVYFDVKASDGDHELSPGADGMFVSQFPRSSSAFRTLFGGVPTTFSSNIDIGAPALAGDGSFNPFTNAWSLTAGGTDIWGTSDQFHYASNSVSGDQVLVARVASLSNPSVWLKAGIMMRDGTAANAEFAAILLTPSNGITFEYRTTAGAAASASSVTGISGSAWVKLVKSGNQFYAFYATTTDRPANGDWRPLGQAAITFTNSTYQAGLALTSHNTATLGAATFTDFGVTPNTLPTGYTSADISGVGKVGTTSDDWANYSMVGGGAGIGGTFDQLQYYSTAVTGSQVLTARLDYLQATSAVSKAGIMFRDSTTSTCINVNLVMTNAGDLIFQKRTTASGNAATVASITGLGVPSSSNPIWLRLIRSGANDFTAYYSQSVTYPTTWTQLGTDAIVNFTNSTYLSGLAVSAGNNTLSAAANFFGLTSNATELGHRITLKSQLTSLYMNLNTTDGYLYANGASATAATAQFDVVSGTVGGDYIALRSVSTGLYVFVDTTDSNRLKATATTIGSSSQFRWNYYSSTQVDFQSPIVNFNFLTAPSSTSPMGFYDATNNFQTRDRYLFTEIS